MIVLVRGIVCGTDIDLFQEDIGFHAPRPHDLVLVFSW